MISIIVPIYNASKYLAGCIDSLLAQTTTEPIRIILVDDGSTDDSLSIAQDYAKRDTRIQVLSQTHKGQSVARNLGLDHATGEYIAFVDADDTIAPEWCQTHLEAISGVDYVQSEQPRNRFRYTVVWGRLYRKTALEHIRFVEGLIYEDILFSVDLWVSGASCRMIPYHGYYYTLNPHSTTSRKHPKAERKVMQQLRQRLHDAPWSKKGIVLYTMIRLTFYFSRL